MRLVVAISILIPLLGLLIADFRWNGGAPGVWLAPFCLLITLAAAAEILDLLRNRDHNVASWSVYTGVTLILAGAFAPIAWQLAGTEYPVDCPLGGMGLPMSAATAALALVFIAEMRRYREPGGVIVNVALALFAIMYLGLLMSFVIKLRMFHDNNWGMAALVSLAFVTKWSDIGAYACGRTLGRHKLAPLLSPNKTIEGAVGGVVFAAIASVVFFYGLAPLIVGTDARVPEWWACLLYGVVIAVAGIIGDLSESLLKRDMDRKDSSRWLPGLGGVLDILDSVLMAAPPAYLCWVSGLVGP
jgi:phosphatidate cytidylyltransferase